MASVMATRRLRKELSNLQKDPPPDIIAEPKESDILTWFFALRGPVDTPYHSGVYIGKLRFPKEYPMKAPSILMLTPSGRFKVNQRICMSMSDFHPESWQPSWSVGTILQGVVSFMTSEELTTGGLRAPDLERKRLAKLSIEYNKKNYPDLFQGDVDAAFCVANEAREKAAKAQVAAATRKASKPPSVRNATRQRPKAAEEETPKELTPEEKEKRRIRNAKKRAKQKAKKQAAAANAST